MIDLTRKIKESELEEECEITHISLKRALWFKQNGFEVLKINISGTVAADVKTNVVFSKYTSPSARVDFHHYNFCFTGFSVGYRGTGSNGFKQFLEMFEIDWDFNPFTCSIKDGPYEWTKEV